jgi:signal transduction histidine kinase
MGSTDAQHQTVTTLAASGGPLAPDPDRAFQLETGRLIRARLELATPLYLVFVGLVVAVESQTAGNAGVTFAYALEVLICVAAVTANRMRRFADAARSIALLCMCSLAVVMLAYSAAVGNAWDAVAIGQVCLMTCIAIVLPWGWRPQLALVVVSCGGFLLSLAFLQRTTPAVYPVVGLLTSGTTSVWAAFLLDRYRFQSFAHAADLSSAYARQQEEAEVSTALLHANELLGADVGRADLLERVNQLVVDVLGTEWSSTFVFDEQARGFRFVGNVGSDPDAQSELASIDFPPSSMPIYEELRHGRLVEIADPAGQQLIPPHLLQHWKIGALLCAPIFRHERLVGTVGTGYSSRSGPFSRKQRRLLVGIASALAMGTENQRLIRDLRAANRLKSDFVATMSHELRTPLNVILGYAEMLGEEARTHTDVELFAGRIQRSGRELLELIDATLDLGRMESGRDALRLEPVSVATLLAEVETEVDAVARTRGLPVVWRSPLGALTLFTDRVKLKTVLKNLVGNAIKYTPQGSVEVAADRDGDELVVRVTDTGVGIAAHDVQAIFEMFRRIDGAATRAVGGVGLGLYIVRQLVDRLGGSIGVESTPGVGSTFVVRVPLRLVRPSHLSSGDLRSSSDAA